MPDGSNTTQQLKVTHGDAVISFDKDVGKFRKSDSDGAIMVTKCSKPESILLGLSEVSATNTISTTSTGKLPPSQPQLPRDRHYAVTLSPAATWEG